MFDYHLIKNRNRNMYTYLSKYNVGDLEHSITLKYFNSAAIFIDYGLHIRLNTMIALACTVLY